MDDDQYQQKLNLSHPAEGADMTPSELRAYMVEQTKLAMEAAVKEFKEEKEKIKIALLQGRLQNEPQTYSEILTERFGAEFTNRFYGFSTISKDVLKNDPQQGQQPLTEAIVKTNHEVLSNATNAFKSMHIAHEICINPNYRLQQEEKIDFDAPDKQMNSQIRKVFWSMVDDDLAQYPPVYDHALKVFEELKDKLLCLLPPHSTDIRMSIIDTLSAKEMKKDIDHDILDFFKYINFIVDCLAKLCEPSRSEQVNAIRVLERPSDIFSRLFEVIDIIQLDSTNYLISVYRPKIQEHCISYERLRFVEFLQFEYELKQDGLRNTRAWLLRHSVKGRDAPSTIAKAFGEILSWNYNNPWPETLALDSQRLANVAWTIKRTTLFGAMALSVIELCKPMFKQNYYVIYNQVRIDLDEKFKSLLHLNHMPDNKKVVDDTEVCAEEAVKIVGRHLLAFEDQHLSEKEENAIRRAVKSVLRADNKTRSVLMMRILQYVEELVFSEGRYKVPITPGLSSIKVEVDICCNEFSRIAYHNRNAYDDIYCDIIEGNCRPPTFNAESKDPVFYEYLQKIKATPRCSTSMAQKYMSSKMGSKDEGASTFENSLQKHTPSDFQSFMASLDIQNLSKSMRQIFSTHEIPQTSGVPSKLLQFEDGKSMLNIKYGGETSKMSGIVPTDGVMVWLPPLSDYKDADNDLPPLVITTTTKNGAKKNVTQYSGGCGENCMNSSGLPQKQDRQMCLKAAHRNCMKSAAAPTPSSTVKGILKSSKNPSRTGQSIYSIHPSKSISKSRGKSALIASRKSSDDIFRVQGEIDIFENRSRFAVDSSLNIISPKEGNNENESDIPREIDVLQTNSKFTDDSSLNFGNNISLAEEPIDDSGKFGSPLNDSPRRVSEDMPQFIDIFKPAPAVSFTVLPKPSDYIFRVPGEINIFEKRIPFSEDSSRSGSGDLSRVPGETNIFENRSMLSINSSRSGSGDLPRVLGEIDIFEKRTRVSVELYSAPSNISIMDPNSEPSVSSFMMLPRSQKEKSTPFLPAPSNMDIVQESGKLSMERKGLESAIESRASTVTRKNLELPAHIDNTRNTASSLTSQRRTSGKGFLSVQQSAIKLSGQIPPVNSSSTRKLKLVVESPPSQNPIATNELPQEFSFHEDPKDSQSHASQIKPQVLSLHDHLTPGVKAIVAEAEGSDILQKKSFSSQNWTAEHITGGSNIRDPLIVDKSLSHVQGLCCHRLAFAEPYRPMYSTGVRSIEPYAWDHYDNSNLGGKVSRRPSGGHHRKSQHGNIHSPSNHLDSVLVVSGFSDKPPPNTNVDTKSKQKLRKPQTGCIPPYLQKRSADMQNSRPDNSKFQGGKYKPFHGELSWKPPYNPAMMGVQEMAIVPSFPGADREPYCLDPSTKRKCLRGTDGPAIEALVKGYNHYLDQLAPNEKPRSPPEIIKHRFPSSLSNEPGTIQWVSPSTASDFCSADTFSSNSDVSLASMAIQNDSRTEFSANASKVDMASTAIPPVDATPTESRKKSLFSDQAKRRASSAAGFDQDQSDFDDRRLEMNESPGFLTQDRFPKETFYRYAPQMMQGRTNPFLLTRDIPDNFRFKHPLLNQIVLEIEEYKKWCANPPACKKEVEQDEYDDWLDVDDIEGENWRNHWILHNDAISKHYQEQKEKERASVAESRIDKEKDKVAKKKMFIS